MTDPVIANDPNPANEEDDNPTSILLDETDPVAPPVVPPVALPVATDVPVEYEPTGDVGMDMALAFVGKLGLGLNHPAMQAAQNGDFSILKATLAAKGTAGWEQFVALGEAAYQREMTKTATASAAARALVVSTAGGEDNWKAIQTWAGANATPEEKAAINAQLNAGGVQAKMAAQYLVSVYNKANPEVTPKDPIGDASRGGVPSAEHGPLSPRQYSDAVQALNNKLGGRLEGSREYAMLQQRRASYRG